MSPSGSCRASSPDPSNDDAAHMRAAKLNSLDPSLQVQGLRARALAIADTIHAAVGPQRMHVHPEVYGGDCGPFGACSIGYWACPYLPPGALSPKQIRVCLESLSRVPLPAEFVAAVGANEELCNIGILFTPAEILAKLYQDVQQHPKYCQLLDSQRVPPSERDGLVRSFLVRTASEANGEALFLSAELVVLATCYLFFQLGQPIPCIRPHILALTEVRQLLARVPPGDSHHFLFGNDHHFVAVTLSTPALPPPAHPVLGPAAAPSSTPTIAASPPGPTSATPSPSPMSSPPTPTIRPPSPSDPHASTPTTPRRFLYPTDPTRRCRGFGADSSWLEPDPNVWRSRLCRLQSAPAADLRWVLQEFPSFHRLCILHGCTRRTPSTTTLLELIDEADKAFPGLHGNSIFDRVRDLGAPLPDIILGLETDLEPASLSQSSMSSTCAESPPLPVCHDTGACPPDCRGCISSPQLDEPSSPAATLDAGSCPVVFCRSDGTRRSGFGRESTGLYSSAKQWRSCLPCLRQASTHDLTWLLRYQWPQLHQGCLSNQLSSPVVALRAADPAMFARIQAIPLLPSAPSPHASGRAPYTPLRSTTSSQVASAATHPPLPSVPSMAPAPSSCTAGHLIHNSNTRHGVSPSSLPRRVCGRPTPASTIVPPPPELAAPPPMPAIPAWATHNEAVLWFDGGTQENNQLPGRGLRPSGAGFALYRLKVEADGSKSLDMVSMGGVWLGDFSSNTNNIAEYNALLWGLRTAWERGATKITVVGDSQLVIRQLDGSYQVRDSSLQRLHQHAQHLLGLFESARAIWVPRAENGLADRLANLAIFHRSSLTWSPRWDWSTAMERWSELSDLAPLHYAVSCPEHGPSIVPLYHSPAQVVAHLEGLFRNSSCISSTEFRSQIVETFRHASLRPDDLLHDGVLFLWARNVCQSRATRSTASHSALRVQLSAADGTFESFWCSVVALSRLPRLPPPLSRPPRGGPPFGNLSWHNPLTTSTSALPGHGSDSSAGRGALTTGRSTNNAPCTSSRPRPPPHTMPAPANADTDDPIVPPPNRDSTHTHVTTIAGRQLTNSSNSSGDVAASTSRPGAQSTPVPAPPRGVPAPARHGSDEPSPSYQFSYHWDQSRPPRGAYHRSSTTSDPLSSDRPHHHAQPHPRHHPDTAASTTSTLSGPALPSVVVVPPPCVNNRREPSPDLGDCRPRTRPPNASAGHTMSPTPAIASLSRNRGRPSSRRSRVSPRGCSHHRPGSCSCSDTQGPFPYDGERCPHPSRRRSSRRHTDTAASPRPFHDSRSRVDSSSSLRDSHLVTVKWIDPSLPDQHVLDGLRNTGLFIPAGTKVFQGQGEVRVLGFSSVDEVRRLLSSKGTILRQFPHISINPGMDTARRRMPFCERQAIQLVLRSNGPRAPCRRL